MKKLLLLLHILSCCLLSYAQSSGYGRLDQTTDCRKNAANKIVDNYSKKISDYHNIIDIDIIDHPIEGYSNRYLFSIQWVARHNGETKIFWINGILSMENDCCKTKFLLQEYSNTVNPTQVDEYLDCTKQFDQRSLGSGKPFQRGERSRSKKLKRQ
jgi:hypothetical protein